MSSTNYKTVSESDLAKVLREGFPGLRFETEGATVRRVYGDNGVFIEFGGYTSAVKKRETVKVYRARLAFNETSGQLLPPLSDFNDSPLNRQFTGDAKTEVSEAIWSYLKLIKYSFELNEELVNSYIYEEESLAVNFHTD